MNETKLKKDFTNIDRRLFDKIEQVVKNDGLADEKNKEILKEFLNNSDYEYCNMIAEYICSLFNVERANMLTKDKKTEVVQARCLWWYALHFLLKKSHREIALYTAMEDITWDKNGINKGIARISDELRHDSFLYSKWLIIDKIIKTSINPHNYNNPFTNSIGHDLRVRVWKPKDVNIDIIEE